MSINDKYLAKIIDEYRIPGVDPNTPITLYLPRIIIVFVSNEYLRNLLVEKLSDENNFVLSNDERQPKFTNNDKLFLYYVKESQYVRHPEPRSRQLLEKGVYLTFEDIQKFNQIKDEIIDMCRSIFEELSGKY